MLRFLNLESVARYCSEVWRRTKFLFSGFWLIGVVALFVAIRFAWIQLHHPAHIKEMVAAYGADSLFYGVPQVDHAGSRFAFLKTSDFGYGLFICDVITGQKQMVCEENGQYKRHDTPDINALSWSPDDNFLLYTLSNKLMAYSPDTKQSSVIADIDINAISDLAWLNTAEFVCVIHQTNLWDIQRQEDGKWKQSNLLSRNSGISSLTPLGDDAIAWQEDNLICRATLGEILTDTNVSVVTSSNANYHVLPTNGLALWLDASVLKQPDQASVSRLIDLSRNKNDAIWNGRAPVLNGTNSESALNGKPTVHFTSLNAPYYGTGLKTRNHLGIAGTVPRSVFVVMRHNANRSMAINIGDTTAKGALFAIEFTNYLYLPAGWKSDNRIKMVSTNWNILEVTYDGKNERGYVNGILRGMAANVLNTADREVEIGLRTIAADKNFKASDGDFAELLIYDRVLNLMERRDVESYLRNKWFGKKNEKASTQKSYLWFVPPVDGLASFSYSKESGLFLFNNVEGRHSSLYQYDPLAGNLVKIAEGSALQNEQWFGNGEYAYSIDDANHRRIVLKDSFGGGENEIPQNSNLRWFEVAPDGQNLLFLGMTSNEPSVGIWKYDLATKKLNAVVPYSDYPSVYAKNIVPFDKQIKTSRGSNLAATIFAPADLKSHKKYPLIIGDTRFNVAVNGVHGRQWVPCVAAAGAYVVIVERRGWFVGIENWNNDVLEAYSSLKKELPIDTDQVYLFGSSAEVAYLNKTVTNSPGLWKGAILLNPGADFPDFSKSPVLQRRPKILVSAGGDEGKDEHLKSYQQIAMKWGVTVEYVTHAGEGHHIVSNAAQLERTEAIMHFIFEE